MDWSTCCGVAARPADDRTSTPTTLQTSTPGRDMVRTPRRWDLPPQDACQNVCREYSTRRGIRCKESPLRRRDDYGSARTCRRLRYVPAVWPTVSQPRPTDVAARVIHMPPAERSES